MQRLGPNLATVFYALLVCFSQPTLADNICTTVSAARPEFTHYQDPTNIGNSGPFLYKTKTAVCDVEAVTQAEHNITYKTIKTSHCEIIESIAAQPPPRQQYINYPMMADFDGPTPKFSVGFYYFDEFACAFAVAERAQALNRKAELHYAVATGDGAGMAQLISISIK